MIYHPGLTFFEAFQGGLADAFADRGVNLLLVKLCDTPYLTEHRSGISIESDAIHITSPSLSSG